MFGNKKANLVTAILFGTLFVASFTVFLVFLILKKVEEYSVVSYSLIVSIPIFSIAFIYFFSRFLST